MFPIVAVLPYTATMNDDDLPQALALLPEEDEQVDFLEILYCRAVPILAVLCAEDPLAPKRIQLFKDRMKDMFPEGETEREIECAIVETMRFPQELLAYLVNYVFRTTQPFLDDANALYMSRMICGLAGTLSDAGWEVLLKYGSPFFLTKNEILQEDSHRSAT